MYQISKLANLGCCTKISFTYFLIYLLFIIYYPFRHNLNLIETEIEIEIVFVNVTQSIMK
jgi:hypothetical protein